MVCQCYKQGEHQSSENDHTDIHVFIQDVQDGRVKRNPYEFTREYVHEGIPNKGCAFRLRQEIPYDLVLVVILTWNLNL